MKQIPLKSVKNVRDIGGLPTADGRKIKDRCVLRGGSLHQLSKEDEAVLKEEYGLKYIIDLRVDDEAKKEPDRIPTGVHYYRIPLREDVRDMVPRNKGERTIDYLKRMPSMPEIYLRMVSHPDSLEALRKSFRIINRDVTQGRSVYIHCSEGKDRTGVILALLEIMLGVEILDIEEDYLLSNEAFEKRNKALYAGLSVLFRDADFSKEFRKMYQADSTMLEGVFEKIEADYGSFEAFFAQELDMTEEKIGSLKDRLLED